LNSRFTTINHSGILYHPDNSGNSTKKERAHTYKKRGPSRSNRARQSRTSIQGEEDTPVFENIIDG